ncbi:MAG: diaminopimelate decarboxylase family protein [Spirochaetia bacterium]
MKPFPDSVIERQIREQVRRKQDPFYIYDTARIRSLCRRFTALPYPLTSVHFACMANEHPSFLAIIREEGLNVFVNSLPHLRQVVACGFARGRIAFSASAMDEGAMHEVRDVGALVNLDSLSQVSLWQRLFPKAPFGIRCNIGELVEPKNTRGGYFIGKESRLGMTPREMLSLSGNRRVTGLHVYVGTDICSLEYFQECYEALASFAGAFSELENIDFGGGFGLADAHGAEFDFEGYGAMAASLMGRVSEKAGRPIRMILEPGRIIGARAGWFVCRVTDVKDRGERQLVGVNASSVQFPRPLLYPDSARHPATLLHVSPQLNGKTDILSSVYGCSTYSRDFLARDVMLPRARIGDIVVLGEAGCYCAAAYLHFLGFARAKEIFYDRESVSGQERDQDVLFAGRAGV